MNSFEWEEHQILITGTTSKLVPFPHQPATSHHALITRSMPPFRRIYLLQALSQHHQIPDLPSIIHQTIEQATLQVRCALGQNKLLQAQQILLQLHELLYSKDMERRQHMVAYRLQTIRLMGHYYLATRKNRSAYQAFSFILQVMQMPHEHDKNLPQYFKQRVELGKATALEQLGQLATAFECSKQAVSSLQREEGDSAKELSCVGYLKMSKLSKAMGHRTSGEMQLKAGLGLARSAQFKKLMQLGERAMMR